MKRTYHYIISGTLEYIMVDQTPKEMLAAKAQLHLAGIGFDFYSPA